MKPRRGARVVTVAAALVPLAGCAYLRDRGRDFTDIVDVKGGAGGVGLGVKARATEFIGTGVGFGAEYATTEKYGRRWFDSKSAFIGLGVFTLDGEIGPCLGSGAEISFLALRVSNETATRPWTWFRFGGEAVLPGVRGGLFVNLGELVDFFAGIAGLDPVHDDGLRIGAPLEEEPEREEKKKEPPAPPAQEKAPAAK